jgi:hypothetical protein
VVTEIKVDRSMANAISMAWITKPKGRKVKEKFWSRVSNGRYKTRLNIHTKGELLGIWEDREYWKGICHRTTNFGRNIN